MKVTTNTIWIWTTVKKVYVCCDLSLSCTLVESAAAGGNGCDIRKLDFEKLTKGQKTYIYCFYIFRLCVLIRPNVATIGSLVPQTTTAGRGRKPVCFTSTARVTTGEPGRTSDMRAASIRVQSVLCSEQTRPSSGI